MAVSKNEFFNIAVLNDAVGKTEIVEKSVFWVVFFLNLEETCGKTPVA